MISRFLNWLLRDSLRSLVAAEVQRQREVEAKHVRALLVEMDDMLEKFKNMVARQAMRRLRDAKKELPEEEEDAAAAPAAPASNADRKRQLRARVFGMAK